MWAWRDIMAQVKEVRRHAMKFESILLAAITQIFHAGFRQTPPLIYEAPKPSSEVVQNLICDCQCFCNSGVSFGLLAYLVVTFASGILCYWAANYLSQPSVGTPSPRRRGHGVLVGHHAWGSHSCVLLWWYCLAWADSAVAGFTRTLDDLDTWWG